ncbi:hypothetical protein [Cryobacterium sp. Y11]|uniref:hypothetical protein n=1 Tax=Cryobacterium sp. Y11 TaxID=2045016 RepID=UPI001304BB98|nr:hypothetical protein [Cryobacterium sp. Y11]
MNTYFHQHHLVVVEQLTKPAGSLAGRPFGAEFGGDPALNLQVLRKRDREAV